MSFVVLATAGAMDLSGLVALVFHQAPDTRRAGNGQVPFPARVLFVPKSTDNLSAICWLFIKTIDFFFTEMLRIMVYGSRDHKYGRTHFVSAGVL